MQQKANLSLFELVRTFNCGIGLLIFVNKEDVKTMLDDLNSSGYNAFLIGSMVENDLGKNVMFDGWDF